VAHPVPAHHADEFLDIVSTHGEDRLPGLVELRHPEFVAGVAGVIELVLDQGAEVDVAAVRAVMRVERDHKVGQRAEPLAQLLLLAGFLPGAAAEHRNLALPEHEAALLHEPGRRPQEADHRVAKVRVLFVV